MSGHSVEIIYCDDDIVVVNKPVGVSVTKDRSGKKQLTDILTGQLGRQACRELRLIHRLDKGTSGVMILARNAQAQSRFTAYFEDRLVEKTYLAVVAGAVEGRKGTVDAPLAPDAGNPQLMRIDRKKGKDAVTDWRLLADFGAVALLAVTPLTGRTHQIRVHLASVGMAVAIDPLYGSGQPLFLSDFKAGYRLGRGHIEKPLMERLALHAYQIVVPSEGESPDLIFIAPPDKKFKATIKMLTKYNPKGPAVFINPDDFEKIINGQKI